MKPAENEVGGFAAVVLWQNISNISRNNIQLAFILTWKESVMEVTGTEVVFKTNTTTCSSNSKEAPTKGKTLWLNF